MNALEIKWFVRIVLKDLKIGVKHERETQVDIERKFFAAARSWWSDYLALSPSHAQRPVKLFALSELGTQVSAAAPRRATPPRHAAARPRPVAPTLAPARCAAVAAPRERLCAAASGGPPPRDPIAGRALCVAPRPLPGRCGRRVRR